MASGWIDLIFGDSGTGKSTYGREVLLRSAVAVPRTLCIYHSPEPDDVLSYGPDVTLRELRSMRKTPKAFRFRGSQSDAIAVAFRAMGAGWRVVIMLDESHETFPRQKGDVVGPENEGERRELRTLGNRLFHRSRHLDMGVILATQWPYLLDPRIRRRARNTVFFGLSTPEDLEWLAKRYGAGAAVQVAELGLYRSVTVPRDSLPDGWGGNIARLRRLASRDRSR